MPVADYFPGKQITLQLYVERYLNKNWALNKEEIKLIGLTYPLRSGWKLKKQFMMVSIDEMQAVKSSHDSNTQHSKKQQPTRARTKEIISIDADFMNSPQFLESFEWRRIRYQALMLHGRKCQCCGSSPSTGAVINVDHIKPRKKYPELALDIDNLQVLCSDCNHGKCNDIADFR